MSDDNFDNLVIERLKEISTDIKTVDSKVDNMYIIHVKNTAVLEEHERRSTASEVRITELEEKELARALQIAKIKGFMAYSGAIITAIGALVYFAKDVVEFIQSIKHLF